MWLWQSQPRFVLRPRCLPLRLIGISCRCLTAVCLNQPYSLSFHHCCIWAHTYNSVLPRQHNIKSSNNISWNTPAKWKRTEECIWNDKQNKEHWFAVIHFSMLSWSICEGLKKRYAWTHRETERPMLSLLLSLFPSQITVFLKGTSQYYISYWLVFLGVCCKSCLLLYGMLHFQMVAYECC